MITRKQVEILKAIIDYINTKGFSPTVREICEAVELQSTSTVHMHLDSLEKLGCITRIAATPRTLAVTDEGMRLLKLIK